MFRDIFEAFRFSWVVVREHLAVFLGYTTAAVSLDIAAHFFLGRFALFVQVMVTILTLRLVNQIVGRSFHSKEYMRALHTLSRKNFILLYCALIVLNVLFACAIYAIFFLWAQGIFWGVGALLFFGGAIIWFFMTYDWFTFFVVTHDVHPLRALRMSRDVNIGRKWRNFFLFVWVFVMNIVGFLCFYVGLIFTIPMTMVMYAYMFRKISIEAESLTTATPRAP